jgi:hypothetical protein
MKKFNKRGFLYFIAFMLMASSFLPVIFNNLPPVVRSHHIWTALWVLSLLFLYPKILLNSLVKLVLVYGLFMYLIFYNELFINIGDWNRSQLIDEFYSISIGLSVITYFRIEGDFFRLAKLVKWTLFFIFITSIMTIVTAILEPTYARSMTGLSAITTQSEIDYFLSFKKYGGGTYGFSAALICIFPIIIYYIRNIKEVTLKKAYLAVVIICAFMALLGTQIFANIIISSFVIIFSLMGSRKINRILVLSSIIILTLLLIPNSFYADLLINISYLFPDDSEIYFKLNESARFISIGNYTATAITVRADRYPLLLNSFFINPWTGHYFAGLTNDISEGAHLHWMNKLASYGFLGSLPFFYIIYTFIKGSLKYFQKEFVFYFLLAVLSIVVLGLMKALAGREMWYMFFIIVSGLYYLPLLKKKNNFNSTDSSDNNRSKSLNE